MSPALVFIPLLAIFIGLFVWGIRYSRAKEQEKLDRLRGACFTKVVQPTLHKAMTAKWGSIEPNMFRRNMDGYTLWYLEKPDSDGPSTPFLAIEFGQSMKLPADAWIMPAFAKEGGFGEKAIGFVARLSGHKHRLPVPGLFERKWWAFGASSAWAPVAPPQGLWEALGNASWVSIKFQKEGLRFEAQSDAVTYKAPDLLAVLDKGFLACTESVAGAFLRASS